MPAAPWASSSAVENGMAMAMAMAMEGSERSESQALDGSQTFQDIVIAVGIVAP